jgi:hypothetical protein
MTVPFDAWLRNDFSGHVSSLLLSEHALGRGWFRPDRVIGLVNDHVAGARNYSRQIWALLTLELWARIFIDDEAVWLHEPEEAWTQVVSPSGRVGRQPARPARSEVGHEVRQRLAAGR